MKNSHELRKTASRKSAERKDASPDNAKGGTNTNGRMITRAANQRVSPNQKRGSTNQIRLKPNPSSDNPKGVTNGRMITRATKKKVSPNLICGSANPSRGLKPIPSSKDDVYAFVNSDSDSNEEIPVFRTKKPRSEKDSAFTRQTHSRRDSSLAQQLKAKYVRKTLAEKKRKNHTKAMDSRAKNRAPKKRNDHQSLGRVADPKEKIKITVNSVNGTASYTPSYFPTSGGDKKRKRNN